MKMMAGAFSLASRKTSRTIRGPSPKYFWTNSEPTTRMKAAKNRQRRSEQSVFTRQCQRQSKKISLHPNKTLHWGGWLIWGTNLWCGGPQLWPALFYHSLEVRTWGHLWGGRFRSERHWIKMKMIESNSKDPLSNSQIKQWSFCFRQNFLQSKNGTFLTLAPNLKSSIKFLCISDLLVELKVCERKLHSFSDFLFLDVHSTNVSIHHIGLLVWREVKVETISSVDQNKVSHKASKHFIRLFQSYMGIKTEARNALHSEHSSIFKYVKSNITWQPSAASGQDYMKLCACVCVL